MKNLNTKKQGDIGLGIAIGWFAKLGYTVSIPLTDSQDYDLVVEINGDLKKIQVKTTRYKKGLYYKTMLKTCGGNKYSNTIKKFDGTKVDYLFIVTAEYKMYLIPTDENTPTSGLTLNSSKDKYIIS